MGRVGAEQADTSVVQKETAKGRASVTRLRSGQMESRCNMELSSGGMGTGGHTATRDTVPTTK